MQTGTQFHLLNKLNILYSECLTMRTIRTLTKQLKTEKMQMNERKENKLNRINWNEMNLVEKLRKPKLQSWNCGGCQSAKANRGEARIIQNEQEKKIITIKEKEYNSLHDSCKLFMITVIRIMTILKCIEMEMDPDSRRCAPFFIHVSARSWHHRNLYEVKWTFNLLDSSIAIITSRRCRRL